MSSIAARITYSVQEWQVGPSEAVIAMLMLGKAINCALWNFIHPTI